MITCAVCHQSFRAISQSHLAKHGLTPRTYLEKYPSAQLGKKQRLLLSHEEAQELYENQRMSANAIAKLKGVHPQLILDDLRYLGLATRTERNPVRRYEYDATGQEVLEALAIGIWMGEGYKNGKKLAITNCNPQFLRIWLRFLIDVCRVDVAKIHLRVTIHDLECVPEAEGYWSAQLGMVLRMSFDQHQLANPNGPIKQPMGTATISVNSVFLIETIKRRAVELAAALM